MRERYRRLLCAYFHIHRVHAFFALFKGKRHPIILADSVDHTSSVNEVLGSTFIALDEAVTFGFIEKFYCTCIHWVKKLSRKDTQNFCSLLLFIAY